MIARVGSNPTDATKALDLLQPTAKVIHMRKQIEQIQNILKKGWEPHEFWGYTTIVMERTLSVTFRGTDDGYGFNALRDTLLQQFVDAGIPARADNKIAFGFKKGDQVIYVGFYDWHIDMGKSVRPDGWLKPLRKATLHIGSTQYRYHTFTPLQDNKGYCVHCGLDRNEKAKDESGFQVFIHV